VSEQDDVRPLLEMLLNTIGKHTEGGRDFVPLEVEQVALKCLFEAHRRGRRHRTTGRNVRLSETGLAVAQSKGEEEP